MKLVLENYVSERTRWNAVKGSPKENMVIIGTPKGSKQGPLQWNVMYNERLEFPDPERATIVGCDYLSKTPKGCRDLRYRDIESGELLVEKSGINSDLLENKIGFDDEPKNTVKV